MHFPRFLDGFTGRESFNAMVRDNNQLEYDALLEWDEDDPQALGAYVESGTLSNPGNRFVPKD